MSEPYSQVANNVLRLLGGAPSAARMAGVAENTAFRWSYERPRGTHGVIHRRHHERLIRAARAEGITLDKKHFTDAFWDDHFVDAGRRICERGTEDAPGERAA